MNIQSHCKSCHKDIFIRSNASTRPELQLEKGSKFDIICLSCDNIENRHVNEIVAKPSPKIMVIGFLITFLVAAIFVIYLRSAAIGLILVSISGILCYQESQSAKNFKQ